MYLSFSFFLPLLPVIMFLLHPFFFSFPWTRFLYKISSPLIFLKIILFFITSLTSHPGFPLPSLPSVLASCILISCHMYNKGDRCFTVKLKGFLIYQNRNHELSFCLGTSAIHGKGLRNTNEGCFFKQHGVPACVSYSPCFTWSAK